jgi:streptogramin lyase
MRPKPEIVDLRFDLYGLKPQYIAIGDQQSLWVTCAATTEVVGLMRDGSIEQHAADAAPSQIVLAGESIWFTMPSNDTVGRIDHAGTIQKYQLPAGSTPQGIVAVSDSVWVTLSGTGELARVAPDGTIDVVQPVVTGDDDEETVGRARSNPQHIAADNAGSLWFTRLDAADIVRMDADRTTESWFSPDHIAPAGIAADNEAVWISDYGAPGIWRIGRSEKLLQRVEPWPTGVSVNVAPDNRGGCWFTEIDEDLVGHIDADAKLTEYDISSYGTRPRGLALDRDGVVWVALWSGGIIGIPQPEQEPHVL